MFENYSICILCDEFIEKLSEGWFSGNGIPCINEKHIPTDDDLYRSHKFGDSIQAVILYNLGNEGMAEDALEGEGFGYFELFSEFNAVMSMDSQGFVYADVYDSQEAARNAWSHIEADYDEWNDKEDDYSPWEYWGSSESDLV